MDLIICVFGLLALVVEDIRCQGVYGECMQFAPAGKLKYDHDLVKQWLLTNRHSQDSQGTIMKNNKIKRPCNINSSKGDKPRLNVMFE